MTGTSSNSQVQNEEQTSELLSRVLNELTGESIRVGSLLYKLRRRSFGGVFLLLATLSLIPGISLIAGLMMIVPAFQLIIGFRSPLLPKILRERRIKVAQIQKIGNKAVPWVQRAERYIKPRWSVLTSPTMLIITGGAIIVLALVITIPLPLCNLTPAIAVALLSFGLLERDGILIFIGLIMGVIAVTIGALITYVAIESVSHFLLNTA
jgi:hypothetical protein